MDILPERAGSRRLAYDGGANRSVRGSMARRRCATGLSRCIAPSSPRGSRKRPSCAPGCCSPRFRCRRRIAHALMPQAGSHRRRLAATEGALSLNILAMSCELNNLTFLVSGV